MAESGHLRWTFAPIPFGKKRPWKLLQMFRNGVVQLCEGGTGSVTLESVLWSWASPFMSLGFWFLVSKRCQDSVFQVSCQQRNSRIWWVSATCLLSRAPHRGCGAGVELRGARSAQGARHWACAQPCVVTLVYTSTCHVPTYPVDTKAILVIL